MGRAIAEAIEQTGGKVCIVDFNEDRCKEVADILGDSGYYECADVSDPKRAEEIVKGAVAKFGYVNVMVNCAGVGSGTRILPREGGVFPLDTFKRVIEINLYGTFNYTCQAALAISQAPENEDGERGVIINTTSLAIELGQIGQAAYSASKGAVHSMTIPIARELARVGIRINTITPGLVSTNMSGVEGLLRAERGEAPPQGSQPPRPRPAMEESPAAKDFIFPRRQGKPSEFASLALEIIRNGHMNGGAYALDGAIRFSPKW
jgi:NAD(P)-dependent dehydrogenase (short-subunit alcohol dehydrogenase family)